MPSRWSGRGAIALCVASLLIPAAGRPAAAQTLLTLEEAMARARSSTPAARALEAEQNRAAAHVTTARAGYFPRIDVTYGVQRGDQPVFVFGSLLSQRRFTGADFAIDALNHPSPVTNVRTAIGVEQPLFDAGRTRFAVREAELSRDLAEATRTGGGQDLAVAGAEAFVRVLQLEAEERAAAAAVTAAESDLSRARARRDAGVVTTADVLAMEVHLADVRQRQIATTGDLTVARLRLADVTGLPLDASVALAKPADRTASVDVAALVQDALASRAERRQAILRADLAATARRAASAAFLPTAGVQAAWEFSGSTWSHPQSSWIVGAQLQLNLFKGFADVSRLTEARQAEVRARAERERLERLIEVDVRAAAARLATARARSDAGRAAVAQAQESQRIVRDRYDSGLATATDVLRAGEAVLNAESRATDAEMRVILETVALDRAAGRL